MPKTSLDHIIIRGARQHNLKNIDLEIPKNKMVVFTGVSGSGKSSLAMDTIYAEGQRRYIESLSSYARQFLGVMDKPDVDKIEGLSPAIAIDQKTTSKNPRSTVGTVTEIYDFLRLLFSRIGHPHCQKCGREIQRQSQQEIVEQIVTTLSQEKDFNTQKGVRFFILSPVVKDRKGEYSALFENLKKQGISKVRLDGNLHDLKDKIELIKTNKHTIDAIVYKGVLQKANLIKSDISQHVETSLRLGSGNVILSIISDKSFDFPENPKEITNHLFSENFACPVCNISLPEMEPRSFSFNSPHGACPVCDGLGNQRRIDESLIYNPNLTVDEGGILPWSNIFEHTSWTQNAVKKVSEAYGIPLNVPLKKLDKNHLKIFLYGVEGRRFKVTYRASDGREHTFEARFEGVIPNLMRRYKETQSDYIRKEIEKYMLLEQCPKCHGSRLKDEILSVVVDKKNINEVTQMSVLKTKEWCEGLKTKLTHREIQISEGILKEINYRLKFLIDVGLNYLTLGRASAHLSGGEAQRIRLASQIGSGLSGVLYVLDEPSIGLHQKDQKKLINTLHHLRDLGNTVLVVEHDAETMLDSDYIFDFGPGAGIHGGECIAQGTPDQIKKDPNSLTGRYLSKNLTVGSTLQKINELNFEEDYTSKVEGKSIILKEASGRNLKKIDLQIPLGKVVCVTGVSGSGKSTLIMDTLYTTLRQHFGLKIEEKPLENKGILGLENITNVIAIDQSPIGRTPKSNPATYTKTFDLIRDLFSQTQEARIRGYKSGRFSFNVKGGRCEACSGEGQIKIEMQFMPDVYVKCEVCQGKRYNDDALDIHYKGKNISEVLDMTVEDALAFFENIPSIRRKIQTIYDVGLGYIKLGQPATTLSGGEAQRVKLALELSKMSRGSTLYILDEPTTGLHFADLENLIHIFKKLTSKGNTVLVIEHNLDVVKNSDWVVDLGPEGGEAGGEIMFNGSVKDLYNVKNSYTSQALRLLG